MKSLSIRKLFVCFAFFTTGFGAVHTVRAYELPQLGIGELRIAADSLNGFVTVDMVINPARFQLSGEREMVVIPVITSTDGLHSDSLPPLVVAGRTRYYRRLRDRKVLPAGALLLRSGADGEFTYSGRLEWEPWMTGSRVTLSAVRQGCCGDATLTAELPVAEVDLMQRDFRAPDFVAEAPVIKNDKTRELKGSAFVDFRVNRTDIDAAYRANPVELAKILATIRQARDIPDATVTAITVKGYASPEGSWANNTRLAQGRTRALKEYIQMESRFDDAVFHTDYCPEDWQGLRDTVATLALPSKAGILELIDAAMEPDAKEAAIKQRYPSEYKFLLQYIYPALRHSDYTVEYSIREYTDLEEIKRMMHERPENLSLREFHLLATSYPAGSVARKEVFETAVMVYPADPVSNINMAVVAVETGDYEAARIYLSRCGDTPGTTYLRGVMLARQRQYDSARALFEEAQRAGVPQATEALATLTELSKVVKGVIYTPVTLDKDFTE